MSKFFNLGRFVVDKAVKALPRSKKVSPTIKSVPRTKLSVKESLKKTKSKEYSRRIDKLETAQKKIKEGKKMMQEGQKTRKKMKDTGTAFTFKGGKSYHSINPAGDVRRYKIKKGVAQWDNIIKKEKQ